jgi:hypothetical protein
MMSMSFGSRAIVSATILSFVSAPFTVSIAQPTAPVAAPAPIASPIASPPPAPVTTRIPEGTEIHVHLNDQLSSATSGTGDTFSIVNDQEFTLPDGTVIPAGYSGKGEVTQVEKSGMLGKPGTLSIKLDYLKIGAVHVHLRGTRASEGKSNVTTMVVTTVLLSGLGLFIHGHSMVLPRGQPLVAYVDEDAMVALPLAAPPIDD